MVKPRENRVPIMMSEDELQAIDSWRFRNRIATRSDAIRRLCQNALGLDDEVARLMDQAEALLDEAGKRHEEDHGVMMQVNGRPARKGVPSREWNVVELADRALDWVAGFYDRLHVHYLDMLRLNNRVISMSNAPTLTSGKLAARRDVRAIDKLKEDFWSKKDEGSENRRLFNVMMGMDEKPGERARYEEMSEEDKEAYLEAKLTDLQALSHRLILLTDAETEQRRTDEPDDDALAVVVAGRIRATPGHDVDWYLSKVLAAFDGKVNPVRATEMIRAALQFPDAPDEGVT